MLTRQVSRVALVGITVMAAAGAAAAQPEGQPTSRLTLEEIDNGWVVGPDFRVTEVNGEASPLAGIYGGWLMDHQLLIGAGAYWLVDGPNETDGRGQGPA